MLLINKLCFVRLLIDLETFGKNIFFDDLLKKSFLKSKLINIKIY